MRKFRQCVVYSITAFTIVTIFASCATTKNVSYFKDIPDSVRSKQIVDAPYKDPLIIPDDILSVTIITIDPTTAAPVNQTANEPVSSSSIGGGASPLGMMSPTNISPSQLAQGLLVDKNGNISLPILGTVKVGGLSTSDAKIQIQKIAEKYFKEPDVQIRFQNFKITVIGEVSHPSTFIMPSEKVSILDAIGMAGDLTIYGRRENVLLIREVDGVKHLERIDLNNSDLFKSPYFYLKQNDVVYVEPNKSKRVQADAAQTRDIAIGASIITGILLLVRFNTK